MVENQEKTATGLSRGCLDLPQSNQLEEEELVVVAPVLAHEAGLVGEAETEREELF